MKYPRHAALLFLSLIFLFAAAGPAEAKDVWTQVRSKNFFLVGNASEKDIRKVGTRLEQFRETFRLLFVNMKLSSAIPTNVVVFKSDSAFRNFKPKRSDGKIDNFIAGYFQPGQDVNYISLSSEGDGSGDGTKFAVIFHEYVHFIVNTNFGKSEVPAWFNEGLAEYYETFAIENDQMVKLGLAQFRHIDLLQQSKVMPLDTLFNISNSQLQASGDHSRSVFYAESWALIHYLMQTGKSDALGKFLNLLLADVPPAKAFQDAFQIAYPQMEAELRKYISKSSFNYHVYTLKNKLLFDAEMQASPLDEADSNAYLGDLLYHTNRDADAEPFLETAVRLKPESSMANATLGMVKMRERKFDEAKKYLETAISLDQRNHVALYRYAFLLSREGQDEMGFSKEFQKDTADKMRDALNRAIAINPAFTESYELLAYVNLVRNENLDESIALLRRALSYQPGNQRYALRIGEILLRQNKLADAALIAGKIVSTADDPEIRSHADLLMRNINEKKQFDEQVAAERKRIDEENRKYGNSGSGPADGPPDGDAIMRSINSALRKPAPDEKRVIGKIVKIDCKVRPLAYTVKTATESFTLNTNDFESLTLNAYVPEANQAQIGCDENIAALNAIITYRPKTTPKGSSRGDLVAVEFVSGDFRFLEPLPPPPMSKRSGAIDRSSASGTMQDPPPASNEGAEEIRRAMMMRAINDALRKPADGEKREMGYLDKIECTGKAAIFVLRTSARTFRLVNSSQYSLKIGVFTPDLSEMQIGCGIKPIEIPAVFIYTDKLDAKVKADGEIVSLEFVPKIFVLQS